jgi:hypothetical protein
MRHDWSRDSIVLRHLAAFPIGGVLATTIAVAFANLQPWGRGISFIGSLWLFITLWLIALLAAYFVRRPGRLVIGECAGILLGVAGVIGG